MAKILAINPLTEEENVVATFKATNEAFSCAEYLQSMVHPDTPVEYWVQFISKGTSGKGKGWSTRRRAGKFRLVVNQETIFVNHSNYAAL